jgi:hypothetical protein
MHAFSSILGNLEILKSTRSNNADDALLRVLKLYGMDYFSYFYFFSWPWVSGQRTEHRVPPRLVAKVFAPPGLDAIEEHRKFAERPTLVKAHCLSAVAAAARGRFPGLQLPRVRKCNRRHGLVSRAKTRVDWHFVWDTAVVQSLLVGIDHVVDPQRCKDSPVYKTGPDWKHSHRGYVHQRSSRTLRGCDQTREDAAVAVGRDAELAAAESRHPTRILLSVKSPRPNGGPCVIKNVVHAPD